jgi:hypothetical protein
LLMTLERNTKNSGMPIKIVITRPIIVTDVSIFLFFLSYL